MLISLTRKKFEELIPRVATGEQYKYTWGKLPDFLRRLLISIVGLVVALLMNVVLGEDLWALTFTVGITAGFYWLWSPVYWASLKNFECRRYPYSGFWRGKVLDVFVTEELIGKEETVNKMGELVIVENRERRLNLEVGDEAGFVTELQVPLKRDHRIIRSGDMAEMLVMSNLADLSRIGKVSDIYFPNYNLWVSAYPYLRRDIFVEVSKQMRQPKGGRPRRSRNERRFRDEGFSDDWG
ncbi:MAG: phosphate ABC transporter permease [Oscillatoriophycideae cyanobacterium NC_groundwater_1537_Pr4_S-0.65um_50_18]|nr:phosphate ABC transporter permease [Oscillatoriophycideae cyanobacterium NC_groundwater_1537_Pr4_S-0.65um_50_18]